MRYVRSLLLSWGVNALVLTVVTGVLENVSFDGARSLLLSAAVFGVLNTVLKPLLRVATLPLRVLTLGLILFAVSMAMLWLTSVIVGGFEIDGFWALVQATLWVWIVNVVLDMGEWAWERRRRRPAGGERPVGARL